MTWTSSSGSTSSCSWCSEFCACCERIENCRFCSDARRLVLCSIAHLRAYEMGFGGEDDDDEGSNAKIGSKEWLKARRQHIIKKTKEEGFQDRAIRFVGSSIVVIVMLTMLYGAIGLLSGDGVDQLPCETIRKLARAYLNTVCLRLSCKPVAGLLLRLSS